MTDFVAIEWGKRQLIVLDAEVARKTVCVRQSFRLDWPEDIDCSEQPQEAGQWLQSELQRRGVTAREVLISLSRNDTIVRQLDVPDVPEEELPDLVRLQAETASSSSLEHSVLDFVPLPRAEQAEGRAVMMATVARNKLEEIQTAVQVAGLRLASIGMNALGTVELVAHFERQRQDDADETTLVVTVRHRQVDISLMRHRHLLLTHSAQTVSDDSDQKSLLILAEIRRSLGALSRMDAGVVLDRAFIIGRTDDSDVLCQTLTDHLDCNVTAIHPSDLASISYETPAPQDNPARDAPLLGMLLATGQPLVLSVDFLRPRKSVARVDPRKLTIAVVAAGIFLTAAVAYGSVRWRVSRIEADISDRREQLTRLEQAIKKGRQTLTAAGVVDDWITRDVDWLHILLDLKQALPGTDHIIMLDCRFSPASGVAVARVRATGIARLRQDVEQLYQRLAERQYHVRSHEITPNPKNADYPYRFQLDLGVAPTWATGESDK